MNELQIEKEDLREPYPDLTLFGRIIEQISFSNSLKKHYVNHHFFYSVKKIPSSCFLIYSSSGARLVKKMQPPPSFKSAHTLLDSSIFKSRGSAKPYDKIKCGTGSNWIEKVSSTNCRHPRHSGFLSGLISEMPASGICSC